MIDIDVIIRSLKAYRNSMTEFEPEEIDVMIEALEDYKEVIS